ncbi:MAG: glutathione S-transferase N-terminal domain-containing protein [Alphaproteobacteria bacterium]
MTPAGRGSGGGSIKLYDLCGADPELRFSAPCWKTKLALAHKGLAYTTIAVPFAGIAAIAGGGFTRTVPVLDDQGRLVRDSFAIALHLDETYPDRPLFGGSGPAMARFVETAVGPASSIVSRMIIKDIHDQLAPADQDYFRRSREQRLGRSLEEAQQGVEALADDLAHACNPVRRALAHGDFLGGEAPLFVDYAAAGPLIWLYMIAGRIPFAADDPVMTWFARLGALYGGLIGTAKTAGTQ